MPTSMTNGALSHGESGQAFGQGQPDEAGPRGLFGSVPPIAVWTGLICLVGIILAITEVPTRQRTIEGTAQMERLAITLGHAKTIPPATALKVAELVRHPYNDCTQVRCDPSLETRNLMARSRLMLLLGPSAFADVSVTKAATTGHAAMAQ